MQKGFEVKLLDHGYLKLVDWMGDDSSIIEAARMSTGKGFLGWGEDLPEECVHCGQRELDETSPNFTGYPGCSNMHGHKFEKKAGDEKLLKYLYENRHDTPFEMVELLVEVQAPIMVFREWHRHRSQSYNEMSARYVQMPNLHYIPSVERIIAASKKHRNKQQGGGGELKMPQWKETFGGSAPKLSNMVPTETEIAEWVRRRLAEEQQSIYALYEALLGMGIAPEIARIDTPVSRYSRMRAKANLRNWLAFLTLRSDAAAMWEIRQYAYALGYFISDLFPRTWDLWLNAERKKPEIDKNGFIIAA